MHAFRDPDMEYPNCFLAMTYSVEPEITEQGILLQDCGEGDSPRHKGESAQVHDNPMSATSVGVIGGADGPTAVLVGAHIPELHAACSSLHFEPVEEVEWRAVFSEKLKEDVEIRLI